MTSSLLTRRNLLLGAAAAAGTGLGAPSLGRAAVGGGVPSLNRPVLVNLMLNGGPDFRHLFPPPFDETPGSYGHTWWHARARSQATANENAALAARWADAYTPAYDAASDTTFGIARAAGWLARQWEAGNVAVISNVVGSETRNHASSIHAMELGLRDADDRTAHSGWGGRAAVASGAKVISLTRSTRAFCLGADPAARGGTTDANVVPGADMRNLEPYRPPVDATSRTDQAARAIASYYASLRGELDADSPFARFVETESRLRVFGAAVSERLASLPLPADLDALGSNDPMVYQGPVRGRLADQVRSLHDALACNDLLDFAVASLDYNGWDSHDNQAEEMAYNLAALFGDNQALETLWRNLPDATRANVVFVICGEFGRQLVDNGGAGTDHGKGNDMIVIGEPVRGGVYGEKFPLDEIARLEDRGADIEGLTGFEHVFGALADWLSPGAAQTVFPGLDNAPLEASVDLGVLLG